MKRLGIVMVAAASLAWAADSSAVSHWTFAEVKAFEAEMAKDTAKSARNPVLSILQLGPGQSVRRTTFSKSGEAEIHENGTDVFCILTGQGEFVVGGEIVSSRNTNPGEIRGPSIKGGTAKKVGAGDMLIIPPGMPHQIMVPAGQRMTFMVGKFPK